MMAKTTGIEDERVQILFTRQTNKQITRTRKQENKSIDAGMHGTILFGKRNVGEDKGKGEEGKRGVDPLKLSL